MAVSRVYEDDSKTTFDEIVDSNAESKTNEVVGK